MKIEAKDSLRKIGLQLDRNQYPRVYNDGIVKSGDSAIVPSTPGEVNDHVKRQRRPATRSRKWTPGGQGPTNRPWSSGGTTPLISSSLREAYEAELAAVWEAYPKTAIWPQAEGLWLRVESSIFHGLGKTATFLTAIPYSESQIPRSWGFWITPISWEWIGPRHTNFPDGSICAFDLSDKTWFPGDSIVKLLDLYTLWALRQEHLNVFGHWPGLQSAPYPYERLEELSDDEYCGCNKSGRRYKDCCKKNDQSYTKLKVFLDFIKFTRGSLHRYPPEEVLNFLNHSAAEPSITSFFDI